MKADFIGGPADVSQSKGRGGARRYCRGTRRSPWASSCPCWPATWRPTPTRCAGNVFCNGQTSNIALMMINFFRGNTAKALYYPIPILAFFFGTVFATLLRSHRFKLRWARVEMLIFALEFALLFIVGFIPPGAGGATRWSTSWSRSPRPCSTRSSARRAACPYASIFCTGNLRTAAEYFSAFHRPARPQGRRHLRALSDDHRLLRRGRVRQRLAFDAVERPLHLGRLPAADRHHPR